MRHEVVMSWGVSLLVLLTIAVSHSQAQVVRVVSRANGTSDEALTDGFGITRASEDFAVALEDYERYVRKGAWEKAFESLGEMRETDGSALCMGEDGLVVPVRRRIWDLVVALPAAGRNAFDVFYGGQAEALAKRMQAAEVHGDDEALTAARELFGQYFITRQGVEAADLLGDAAFQQGWFNDAVIYWRSILDHHALDARDEARISVKLAYALSRAGRTDALDRLKGRVLQRLADQAVTIGGRSMTVDEAMKQIDTLPADPSVVRHGLGWVESAAAPDDQTGLDWQFNFMSEQAQQSLQQALSNWWGPASGLGGLVPASDSDGKRIYCNWLGIGFAIDAQTGKLLWRTDQFQQLYGNFQNFRNGSGIASRYDLIVAGDYVVMLTLPLDRLNNWREPYRLQVLDGETGKLKWNTSGVNWLKDITFIGRPIVSKDRVIAVAHPQNSSETVLKVMSIQDSQMQWELPLGQATMVQMPNGQEFVPDPTLLLDGDQLYVLTNNGALLVIDMLRHRIAWALKYESPVSSGNPNVFFGNGPSDAGSLNTRGGLWLYDGLLYFKETAGSTLYALDPQQRKVLWKRPADKDATVVGIDRDRVYLLGHELLAIDRRTRGLKWATKLPIGVGRLQAIHDDKRITVLTGRGIYEIDKTNGDTLRIFRGDDLTSKGGILRVMGDDLLCISNHSLSAYRRGMKTDNAGASGDEPPGDTDEE